MNIFSLSVASFFISLVSLDGNYDFGIHPCSCSSVEYSKIRIYQAYPILQWIASVIVHSSAVHLLMQV
jgi:hypothetical protein